MLSFESQHGLMSDNQKSLALARLFDSAIIVLTMIASVALMGLMWLPNYTIILLISIIGFQYFSATDRNYKSWQTAEPVKLIASIIVIWFKTLIMLGAIFFMLPEHNLWNQQLIIFWALITPLQLISWHSVIYLIATYGRIVKLTQHTYAIYGATDLGKETFKKLNTAPLAGQAFIGFFDDRKSVDAERKSLPTSELKGNFSELCAMAKEGRIERIYIAMPFKAEERIRQLYSELSDSTASVILLLDLFSYEVLNSRWMDIQGIPAISLYDSPYRGFDSFCKRIFDLIFSILALSILAIPMLIISLLIKVSSPGPVIFKQKRYGYHGKSINVWKFRTMTCTDSGESSISQAKRNDPRVTKFGSFLRKTSLDELPQFINVFMGSMSIVGPRPHAVYHNEYYRNVVHGYMLRHKTKPGITGLAQINGCRGETDTVEKMEARIRYDLLYICNWSILEDIRIIIKTILGVLFHRNAY